MYPGLIFWWKQSRQCGPQQQWAGCGVGAESRGRQPRASTADDSSPSGASEKPRSEGSHGADWGFHAAAGDGCGESGGGFGVRRPLRFLAYKLDLSDVQVAELARILNDLKTERAQAEVDDRRALAALADSVAQSAFDESKAQLAATQRVQSEQRLQDAVVKALAKIHALLSDQQRAHLAYLIRTGTLTL
jgi:Spy/CpxP family protein refolding chaperone